MPHVTLEYTDNIDLEIVFDDLFSRIHSVLVEVGGLKIGNCKSRAVRLDSYHVGDGAGNSAFVHVDIRFLEGRPPDVKNEISRAVLEILVDAYGPAVGGGDVQLTVEVRDIERNTYAKFPAGSLEYP